MAAKPKIKGPSEKEIQESILDWLSYQQNAFVWRNNNVGVYDPRTEGFRRLPKYSMRGVSDIIGLWNGRGLAIECKSKTGKLSAYQEAFLNRFKQAGGITIVARSIEDVCAVLLSL
jgi:hypothetical protein